MICIDPSIQNFNTGWAVFKNKKVPTATGIIKLPKHKSVVTWESQCYRITESLLSVMIMHSVKKLYVEMPRLWSGSSKSFSSASSGGLFKLTYLVGCIGFAAHGLSIKTNTVEPVEWKGQLHKKAVDVWIKKIIKKKYPDHVSDAVGIGLWAKGLF